MVVIKSIDPFSLGKIFAVIYAIIGFFYGLAFFVISSILAAFTGSLPASGFGAAITSSPLAAYGMLPGSMALGGLPLGSLAGWMAGAAIIALPVVFGIGGFVLGSIAAGIYNVIASKIGGIKVQLDN
jgi:hypothetical protein